jgi:photosystem II stability/assembly factor-like uncharacterized protein
MNRVIFSIAVTLTGYAGTNAWTPLGPYGGSATTLAADPRNAGTLYAASGVTAGDGGRLYKTTDGGANWTRLDTPFGAASLAVDPQDTDTIYVGLRGKGDSGAWVFKSSDGGASFNLANSGLEGVQFYGHLIADAWNPGTIYAIAILYFTDLPCRQNCLSTQVFKSTDGAASWSAASAGLPSTDSLIEALAVDPQDSRILYAGLYGVNQGTSGIFKSTDGGASWSGINSTVTVCCTYFGPGLVIDPLNHDRLYAASFGGVARLSSAGRLLDSTALGGGDITSLGIDQGNPGTLYATATYGNSGVFKSADGGSTWTATTFASQGFGNTFWAGGRSAESRHGLCGLDERLRGGEDDRRRRQLDGDGPWAGRVEPAGCDRRPRNPGTLYGSSAQRVYKTTDGGGSWAVLRGLQGAGSLLIDPRDSATLFAVSGGVLKSADGGATWNEIGHASWVAASAALGPNGRYGFPGALILDPQNPDTLYVIAIAQGAPGCCRTDVFKSTDGGMSWGMAASWQGNDVTLLAMDPENSSTLYAAGTERSTISKSTDGGVTWKDFPLPPEAIPTGDDDDWAILTSMAIDSRNSDIVYASGSGGIFKSTDGGASWTTVNAGLAPYACTGSDSCFGEPYRVGFLVIEPRLGTLYAASRAGVLRSGDGGSRWVAINDGLPTPPGANSLALDPINPSTLYAALSGVYSITLVPEIRRQSPPA